MAHVTLLHHINKPMNKNESLLLLKGRFTADEARELLIELFHAKIQFHEKKNFSSQERFGCKDRIATERIPELKESLRRVQELVAQAAGSNKRMIVTSTVHIEFADQEVEVTPSRPEWSV